MTDKVENAAASGRLEEIAAELGGNFEEPRARDGLRCIEVDPGRLLDLLAALRDDPALRFGLFLDVTAVDHYGREPRFEMVYHLYSVELGQRLRIKSWITESSACISSAVGLFPGADFHEREAYDMFGITFDGHPDLRRILMPDEFEHHPLRKEYPLEGIEPEKVYRMKGGVMMPRPDGAGPIQGAGCSTP